MNERNKADTRATFFLLRVLLPLIRKPKLYLPSTAPALVWLSLCGTEYQVLRVRLTEFDLKFESTEYDVPGTWYSFFACVRNTVERTASE